jgi:Ribbon-helix-helix protein, copG family
MKRITISLPDDLAERVDREAVRRRTSFSELVRQLLTEGLSGSDETPREIPGPACSTIRTWFPPSAWMTSSRTTGPMTSVAIADSGPLVAACAYCPREEPNAAKVLLDGARPEALSPKVIVTWT